MRSSDPNETCATCKRTMGRHTPEMRALCEKAKSRPFTCKEAAAKFRQWAKHTTNSDSEIAYLACADILDAFGDTLVPQKLLDEWNFNFEKDEI